MLTIEHSTNQYFIIDGNDVYASLTPKLEQNKCVLFLSGGKSSLDALLNSASGSIDCVHTFSFLERLSRTPFIKMQYPKSLLDLKAENAEILKPFVIPVRTLIYQSDVRRSYSVETHIVDVVLHNTKGGYDFNLKWKNIQNREKGTGTRYDLSVEYILGKNNAYGTKQGTITVTLEYHQYHNIHLLIGECLWEVMAESSPTQTTNLNVR